MKANGDKDAHPPKEKLGPMEECKPTVFAASGAAVDPDWHEIRLDSSVEMGLPAPPWASIPLERNEEETILSQFRPATKKSPNLRLGRGFDQVWAQISDQGDQKRLVLRDQSWTFADFNGHEGQKAARQASTTILKAYNFPLASEQTSDLSVAWAWHGKTLLWARVPPGSQVKATYAGDPLSLAAERAIQATGQTTNVEIKKPASDTWKSATLNPRFYELLPPSAPIHWALAVENLLVVLDRSNAWIGQELHGFVLEALEASFDAGVKTAEFHARRLSGSIENWERTTEAREKVGARAREQREQEAAVRWYSAAKNWLKENMPQMQNFSVEKIYDAAVYAEELKQISLPGFEQFRQKFVEWEGQDLFTPRRRRGKPGRPPKNKPGSS